jgi:hypothetical protein
VNGFAGRRASACAFVPVSGLLPTAARSRTRAVASRVVAALLRCAVCTIACILRPGARQHGIFFGDWLDGDELSGTKRQGDSTQHRLFNSGAGQCVDHDGRLHNRALQPFCLLATLTNDMRKQVAQTFPAVPQVSRI